MKARGEPLRADDNPEMLKQRLEAYRAQTAPLMDYYSGHGALRSVDGMAPIAEVSTSIKARRRREAEVGLRQPRTVPHGLQNRPQGCSRLAKRRCRGRTGIRKKTKAKSPAERPRTAG